MTVSPVPQHDELYAVSDLHLGGEEGFQIFAAGAAFGRLVDELIRRSADRKVALVINGDLVDFLAEPSATYFDAHGAVDKLDRIAKDPSFATVWKSMQAFVRKKNCHLAITLGNHDLELALPWVRRRLIDILTGGNDSACGRITLAFDGAGYLCKVGHAQVLCVHGNEVDKWNWTDHEHIRQIGRDLNRGGTMDRWVPNGGTELVIDVMNDLKRRFPFIDLLKPEDKAVAPTLLALDDSIAGKLRGLTVPFVRSRWDGFRMAVGLLGEEDEGERAGPTGQQEIEQALRETFAHAADTTIQSSDELMRRAEERLTEGVTPLDLVGSQSGEETLGPIGAFVNWVTGKPKSEVLREALEKLGKDRSFDIDRQDGTFKDLDRLIAPQIDFVLAGHTHLRRGIKRTRGRGFYFNSGTWVRLIRLTQEVLDSPDHFARVFDAFGAGTMEALDEESGLVMQAPTAVCIRAEGAQVKAELCQVTTAGTAVFEEPVAEGQV